MPVQPSTMTGVFHRPFDEQVAFFRRKLGNLVPTQWWDDLKKAEHDRAFMVAGAAKADLLQDLAAAVDHAIADGVGMDAFQKDFEAIVAKHGWTGWTGEETPARRRWRARVIYSTNAQTAYSAGRLAQLRDGKYKLWVYHHLDGELNPRPLHVSWNGTTLPPDHPFWRTHYPPSAWGCKCYVVGARSAADARRLGGDTDKQLPDGWDKIDRTTGEPPGIDKGWGYMPGDTVSAAVRDVASKIQHWDYRLAKAYMQEVPEDARDGLATAYRGLPSTADDARRYAQRVLAGNLPDSLAPYKTLGLLTSDQAERIGTLKRGLDVGGFDFSIDPAGVKHVHKRHAEVGVDEYAVLPQLLNADDLAVRYVNLREMRLPGVEIMADVDGQRYVTVWSIRARRKSLTLHTFYRPTSTRTKKP